MTALAPYALALLFGVVLWRMYAANHRREMDARAHYLDECMALLQEPRLETGAAGYARLSGRYQGVAVHLQLEEDHLTMRKVPVLWLHATMAGTDAAGTLDLLVRPQNTEFYSPSWNWSVTVTPRPGWPQHARCVSADAPPDLDRIEAEVTQLFADEKLKELVLEPQRLRLTYLARQAERGEYLLLRSARFDPHPIPAGQAEHLLQHLLTLRDRLKGA